MIGLDTIFNGHLIYGKCKVQPFKVYMCIVAYNFELGEAASKV